MSIISETFGLLGQVGVMPRRVQLVVTDNLAAVTTPGYLTTMGVSPFTVYKTDIFDIIYDYNAETAAGTYGEFTCTISQAGVITLVYLGVGRALNSFLPTATFSVPGDLSVAYAIRQGYWVQVGDAIIVNAVMAITPTYSTASANFIVTGLPYLSNGSSQNVSIGSAIPSSITFTSGCTALTSIISTGGDYVSFGQYGSIVGCNPLTTLNMASEGTYNIAFGITYFL